MERCKRRLSSPNCLENPGRFKRSDRKETRNDGVLTLAESVNLTTLPVSYDADESDADESDAEESDAEELDAEEPSASAGRSSRRKSKEGVPQFYQARDGGSQTYVSMPPQFDFLHCMEIMQQMANMGANKKAELHWNHREKEFLPSDDGSESEGFYEFGSFVDENQASSRFRLGSIDQTRMINKLALHTPNLSPIHNRTPNLSPIHNAENFPVSGTQQENGSCSRRSPGLSPIHSASP